MCLYCPISGKVQFKLNSMILQSHKTQSLLPILNGSINVKTKESEDRERELLSIPIIVQRFTHLNNLVHPVIEVPLFKKNIFLPSTIAILLTGPMNWLFTFFCILFAQ